MSKNLNAHLYVLVATFLVGGSFIVSQKLTGIVDPISITLLRFVFASICLCPFILLKKKYRIKIVTTFGRAMIISFFYSLFFIGLFSSLEYTSVLNTGTLFTLVPLLTALFSILVFKQYFSSKQYAIYLLGIIGTCIVVFKGSLELFYTMSLNKGDIIFLFSIIAMALYSICAKYFHKKDDELIVLVFMTLVGGSIWMSFSLLILDVPLHWHKIENEQFLYLSYLSIIATLLTSYLYQNATITLGPKKVMSYVYFNPASIALLLFLFEGKTINIWMIVGILISAIATIILISKE